MSDAYWTECISLAADDLGLALTKDQIEFLADAVAGGHENYGMAHGYDAIPNPLTAENDRLKRELDRERSMIPCETCKGRGRIVTPGPYHSSESECHKCRGEGRRQP